MSIVASARGRLAVAIAAVGVSAIGCASTSATSAPPVGQPGPPAATTSWTAPPSDRRTENRAGILIGGGLVILGLWFLVRPYLPDIQLNLIWPVVIVAVGGLILVTAARRLKA